MSLFIGIAVLLSAVLASQTIKDAFDGNADDNDLEDL